MNEEIYYVEINVRFIDTTPPPPPPSKKKGGWVIHFSRVILKTYENSRIKTILM